MLQKIKERIFRHKFIAILIVAALAGGGYWFYQSSGKTQAATRYVLATAQKGTIISSVSGTGQVSSVKEVEVKPETSGTITSVNVSQGQEVKEGQIIAAIDPKNALVSLAQAKASLESAQASYDKLIAGATDDDLLSVRSSVDNAELSLNNAKSNLEQTKKDQQLKVEKAYTELMNSGLSVVAGPVDLTNAMPALSGSYNGKEEGEYIVSLYSSASGLYYNINGLESASGYLRAGILIPLGTRGLYIQFSSISSLGPNDSWTISVPNKKSGSYLTNYNAYQTALQTQTQSIANAENSIKTAELSLAQAQLSLKLKQAAAEPAEVSSAKAQVASAQAQVESAQKAYSSTVVRAPFDGQIAVLNAEKGNQATSATAVATLITKQQLTQVSLNEVDVAKVKIGQPATLTFDAIDDLTLTGKVVEIDAIGSVNQGVVSYNVKIAFDTQDERVKSGMSVSASIVIEAKQDVLVVPSSAVKTQSGQKYVEVVEDAQTLTASIGTTGASSPVTLTAVPQRTAVEVGSAGDSTIEIISGLTEGQTIVTQTISASSSSSSGNSSATGQTGASSSNQRNSANFMGGGGGMMIMR